MNILFTFLYILLFIFCLSVLIVVHELGHFATAKFFKVYVKEFSIGFGPALLHKRRKNGETYFSLRAIPFGGYVSMYGEGMEEDDPELKGVDPSRSFTNLKKWKRIIILFAGVFNNAILALILFLISESCFVQKGMYLNYVGVEEGSKAVAAEIANEDYISLRRYENVDNIDGLYIVDKDTAYITYTDDSTKLAAAILDIRSATYTSRSYDTNLRFYLRDNEGKILGTEVLATETNVKSVYFSVTTAKGAYKQYINSAWVIVPDAPIENPQEGMVYRDKENKTLRKWNGKEWVKTTYDSSSYISPTDIKEFYVWYDLENEKSVHPLSLGVTTKEEKEYLKAVVYHSYTKNIGMMLAK